jgi:ubiquinone/menaquinone biosynthesis C-methylase UbiE
MSENAIPHDDASFDVVVSNQVFEHVQDMEATLLEIARVLKPGGVSFNVFPYRGTWREGHCGIPFLHWFPKGSKPRVYYAALLRSLGLGYFKKSKTIMQWARDSCAWLDRWTYYRSYPEIHAHFSHIIGETYYDEEYHLSARFQRRFDGLPKSIQKFLARKGGGVVLVSTKNAR